MLCISSDTFPPFRVDVAVLFGDKLAKKGHNIDWVLQSEAPRSSPGEEEWNGWRVFVGATDPGSSLFSRIRKHFRGIRNDLKVLTLAQQNNYQFIQVKDKFLAAIIGLIAAWRQKSKFVFWLSYPYPEASLYEAKTGSARYPVLYYIRGWAFKIVLYQIVTRFADHIFVQSEQMKKDMVAEGADPDRMTAVPMGVEPLDLTPATKLNQTYQMIYLGTLLQTRQLDFLVRVLARVREALPEATLLMVGPEELPGDQEILIAEAKRLGVEDALILTGRLPRDTALQHVADSDVCFSPFLPTPILNSTSPTKLVEYLSLKRPVVANDHPEQKMVLNASGGGICVQYDEEQFSNAAIEILNNPERSLAMGEAGYEYVMANRSYSAIADALEQCYFDLRAN